MSEKNQINILYLTLAFLTPIEQVIIIKKIGKKYHHKFRNLLLTNCCKANHDFIIQCSTEVSDYLLNCWINSINDKKIIFKQTQTKMSKNYTCPYYFLVLESLNLEKYYLLKSFLHYYKSASFELKSQIHFISEIVYFCLLDERLVITNIYSKNELNIQTAYILHLSKVFYEHLRVNFFRNSINFHFKCFLPSLKCIRYILLRRYTKKSYKIKQNKLEILISFFVSSHFNDFMHILSYFVNPNATYTEYIRLIYELSQKYYELYALVNKKSNKISSIIQKSFSKQFLTNLQTGNILFEFDHEVNNFLAIIDVENFKFLKLILRQTTILINGLLVRSDFGPKSNFDNLCFNNEKVYFSKKYVNQSEFNIFNQEENNDQIDVNFIQLLWRKLNTIRTLDKFKLNIYKTVIKNLRNKYAHYRHYFNVDFKL